MAVIPTFPRQVRVLKCAMLSPGLQLRAGNPASVQALSTYGFDILPFVHKIDIYESIFENTLSATITLLENVGLTEYFPIVGVETIALIYEVDNQDGSVQRFQRAFRVVGLQNQSFPRHDFRLYELVCVTPQFVTSVSSRICRPFHGVKAVDAVTDVMVKDLGFSKNDINDLVNSNQIEDTYNNIDVVIPNYTPLQTINYFTVLAQTTDSKHESNFLFYETMRDGFSFRSISSIITKNVNRPDLPVFNVDSGAITSQPFVSQDDVMGRVIRAHQNQGFNVLFDIASGMLRSRLVHFDFLARKLDDGSDSRYTNTFDNTTHLAKYPVYPRNFDLSVDKNVRIFTVPSNVWSSKSAYQSSIEGQVEQTLHDAIVLRNRQLKSIKHMETLLDLPGQPEVSAGDICIVNYPPARPFIPDGLNQPINVPNAPLQTPYYSGAHLITAVHHILYTKEVGAMEYRMDIKVNRDSFGAPLIGTADSSET
jgi:hypothetical protein